MHTGRRQLLPSGGCPNAVGKLTTTLSLNQTETNFGRSFALQGPRTSWAGFVPNYYFEYWTYIAWNNVFGPVLFKAFGRIVSVLDQEDLNALHFATVMI